MDFNFDSMPTEEKMKYKGKAMELSKDQIDFEI